MQNSTVPETGSQLITLIWTTLYRLKSFDYELLTYACTIIRKLSGCICILVPNVSRHARLILVWLFGLTPLKYIHVHAPTDRSWHDKKNSPSPIYGLGRTPSLSTMSIGEKDSR